jgi:hypothetical protein
MFSTIWCRGRVPIHKKMNLDLYLTQYYLNMTAETTEPLEENTGMNLCGFGLGMVSSMCY